MRKNSSPARRHLTSLLASLLVAVSGLGALVVPQAAEAATLPDDAPTVSAEALPTWQLDGVVWSTVVVGNTAYVTGEFSKARPRERRWAAHSRSTRRTSSPSTYAPETRSRSTTR
ncbi:hypothetical protein G7085_05205 [Tessaracoccus sp. HDW20]|uniref:hypothetical protein n=1 Tax=Tessaracoccus coleopterorum TaxID=2714950 RepID=UPI0018D3D485|nr:hypothetical protein [Tessaracoccus coleopterorum]NHB84228.1 hypothetical protein [Tessaracoccus coleopterorum]